MALLFDFGYPQPSLINTCMYLILVFFSSMRFLMPLVLSLEYKDSLEIWWLIA